jgi:hypothetical protein
MHIYLSTYFSLLNITLPPVARAKRWLSIFCYRDIFDFDSLLYIDNINIFDCRVFSSQLVYKITLLISPSGLNAASLSRSRHATPFCLISDTTRAPGHYARLLSPANAPAAPYSKNRSSLAPTSITTFKFHFMYHEAASIAIKFIVLNIPPNAITFIENAELRDDWRRFRWYSLIYAFA